MAVGFRPVDTIQQLHQERLRLLNAMDHLQQSNTALQEESRSDPDPELRDALGVCSEPLVAASTPELGWCKCSDAELQENVAVIAKYRTQVAQIEEELQALETTTGGHPEHGQNGLHGSTQRSSGGTKHISEDEAMPDADGA